MKYGSRKCLPGNTYLIIISPPPLQQFVYFLSNFRSFILQRNATIWFAYFSPTWLSFFPLTLQLTSPVNSNSLHVVTLNNKLKLLVRDLKIPLKNLNDGVTFLEEKFGKLTR